MLCVFVRNNKKNNNSRIANRVLFIFNGKLYKSIK